jgi:hypothetical protein
MTLRDFLREQALKGDEELVVHFMDDDLREDVHGDMAPCSLVDFTEEYIRRSDARDAKELDGTQF